MSIFSGCFAPKYKIDYEGKMNQFKGAKEEYRAGTVVKLTYGPVATDTDYHFTLDGENVKTEIGKNECFTLTFTMPEHDATLRVYSENTMEYDKEKEGFEYTVNKSYHSFDGGGPEFTVKIENPELLKCYQEKNYGKKNHEVIDGAAFNVEMRFVGLKPGTTKVTISTRSPIADNFDEIYNVTINDDLKIKMELQETIEIQNQ